MTRLAMVSAVLLTACAAWAQDECITKQVLFKSGEGGYSGYRIPALIVTNTGTVLAFCEGRKNSLSDSGDIDILVRRSTDGGKTWGPVQVVADVGADVIGNPCPVVVRETGEILLPLTQNKGDGPEDLIMKGEAPPRTVWLTRSKDDGQTWEPLQDISATTRLDAWRWYATGPGHGIQMRSGRIVIPCNHSTGPEKVDMHSHVIYSDDQGASWHIGGIEDFYTDESAVVELADGSLYHNMRNYRDRHLRMFARSVDGGLTWSPAEFDDELVEPTCQASLLRYSFAGEGKKSIVVFSNPASTKRENMMVKLSYDECKTWPASKTVHAGPAAYSDLAALPDGTIACLYECGEKSAYETITLALFSVEWVAK